VLDVETTGGGATDEIIEFAGVLSHYDRDRGVFLDTVDRYHGLRQPTVSINPFAARVNGITSEMLCGRSLDEPRIRRLFAAADQVIAHNASFDRAFMGRLIPEALEKPWLCSYLGIDWANEGVWKTDLSTLIKHFHIADCTHHRAEADVGNLITLLATRGSSGEPFIAQLLSEKPHQNPVARKRTKSAAEYFKRLCPSGELSAEQQAILASIGTGKPHLSVDAVAGSAKTTTLMAAALALTGRTKVLAFNKSVADSWNARRTEAEAGRAAAQTFHSFAFAAYKKHHPDVDTIHPAQKIDLLDGAQKLNGGERDFCVDIIDSLQQQALGLSRKPITQTTLKQLLKERHSIRLPFFNGQTVEQLKLRISELLGDVPRLFEGWNDLSSTCITFSDTLYAPIAEKLLQPYYQSVLCDESQDMNAINRLIVTKILKEGGQLAFFGDRHQAIYWFRGADTDSLDRIVDMCSAREMRLSKSFRCAHAVIEEARKIVPHMTAHATNPEGSVNREEFERFILRRDLGPNDAVLCRNNFPLVNTALYLMRNQVACRVIGREIGVRMLAVVDSVGVDSLSSLRRHLKHRIELSDEAELRGDMLDQAWSVIALIDSLPGGSISNLRDLINRLYEGENVQNAVTLSTIHKAKGMEWNRVFMVGNERYLRIDDDQPRAVVAQERNLLYVGITRARERLCFVQAPVGEFCC